MIKGSSSSSEDDFPKIKEIVSQLHKKTKIRSLTHSIYGPCLIVIKSEESNKVYVGRSLNSKRSIKRYEINIQKRKNRVWEFKREEYKYYSIELRNVADDDKDLMNFCKQELMDELEEYGYKNVGIRAMSLKRFKKYEKTI